MTLQARGSCWGKQGACWMWCERNSRTRNNCAASLIGLCFAVCWPSLFRVRPLQVLPQGNFSFSCQTCCDSLEELVRQCPLARSSAETRTAWYCSIVPLLALDARKQAAWFSSCFCFCAACSASLVSFAALADGASWRGTGSHSCAARTDSSEAMQLCGP